MEENRSTRTSHWEPWVPGDEDNAFTDAGLETFARYVSGESVARLNKFTVAESYRIAREDGPAELVSRIYERFLEWNRPYNIEPWLARPGHFAQRIRDPEWINRDSGTCLDFAAVFAAACIEHHLRPYIAILLPDDDQIVGHAIILVDMTDGGTALSDLSGEPDRRVINRVNSMRVLTYAEGGGLIMVDPTLSTRERQGTYNVASEAGRDYLERGRDVALIDPVGIFKDGTVEAYWPPDPSSRPLIGTHFPIMPRYEAIPRTDPAVPTEHERVLSRLTEGGTLGFTVVAGPQGVGKSRLACRAIEVRDDGSGWFLSGTSKDALIESLALAELTESGGDPVALNAADRRVFARMALSRLRESGTSWAVVVDNVTDPGPLLDWLPTPDVERNQRVIVTTTDDYVDAWRNERGDNLIQVPRLTTTEVKGLVPGIDDDVADIVAGRFLFVRTLRRLIERGIDVSASSYSSRPADSQSAPVDEVGVGLDRGALWLWELVRRHQGDDNELDHAALMLALLCPIGLPITAAREAGIDSGLETLTSHGICDVVGEDVSIHRLFAGAIIHGRNIAAVREGAIDLLGTPSLATTVQRRLETETVDRLASLIERTADGSATEDVDLHLAHALFALGAVQELHGSTVSSARSYRRAQKAFEDDGLFRLVAHCLFGRAREVNQMNIDRKSPVGVADGAAAIDEALEWTRRAFQIHVDLLETGADDADPPGPARCQAMEGLLLSKRAGLEEDLVKRRELLLMAIRLLEDSERERKRILGEGPPETSYARATEIARSEFNLGGRLVSLAKTDPPDQVTATLDRAEDVYVSVAKTRREKLGLRTGHPHISACDNGLAIVSYYRSQLLTSASLKDRTKWLRAAEGHIHQAVESRQNHDGEADKTDTLKSSMLEAKIALARVALHEQTAVTAGQRPLAKTRTVLDEFSEEWDVQLIQPD